MIYISLQIAGAGNVKKVREKCRNMKIMGGVCFAAPMLKAIGLGTDGRRMSRLFHVVMVLADEVWDWRWSWKRLSCSVARWI